MFDWTGGSWLSNIYVQEIKESLYPLYVEELNAPLCRLSVVVIISSSPFSINKKKKFLHSLCIEVAALCYNANVEM